MEQVTRVSKSNEQTQALIRSAAAEEGEGAEDTTAAPEGFEALLRGLLVPDQEDKVSEEALFAALTVQRVRELKGEEAAATFEALLKSKEAAMTKANGFIPHEEAARTALKEFMDAGELSAEEADKIHAEAFGAAQLDGNASVLYDHLGGPGDPTLAVLTMTEALARASEVIKKYTAGEEEATTRPLSAGFGSAGNALINPYESLAMGAALVSGALNTPDGTTMDGPDEFLFKPVSDNQGRLAVLLPGGISPDVVSCVLKDSEGNVIEEGTQWAEGYGLESPRRKFNFTKVGGEYPADLTVEARMADGSVVSWKIPDPSQRYD